MVVANGAFDFACLAAEDESMFPLIFKAIREGRVYDVLIAQSLDAIEGGYLGIDPRTGKALRDPETNDVKSRYSLAICCDLVLGRVDAKRNDVWRVSYALLDGIPEERWPAEARQYPVDDAVNTLEVALGQLEGWDRGLDPERGPARNLDNMAAQVEAAFALHLGAAWGIRTDGERIAALSVEVDAKHAEAVKRYTKMGWIRPDGPKVGSEDQAAVKRAIALAYGASGTCRKCRGAGKVERAPKVSEKTGKPLKAGAPRICSPRNFEDEETCDGTGLDLSTAPMLPRADKGGVKTDRDALMESGDDDLHDFGADEFEKIRTTYLPFLRKGIDGPINLRPNVLVATGRVSYSDPIHQFPRKGGARECIIARPGTVFASVDYAAGELCTLAQVCLWLFGKSKMAKIINASKDPGALHTWLAARMLGVTFEEMKARVKAGDVLAKNYRSVGKSCDFGLGGGMGSPKFVMTSRKKNAGETVCSDGYVHAGLRFCVLLDGASRCGTKKITEWKGRACAPVCKTCTEITEERLRPEFFSAYEEVKEYHEWVAEKVDDDGRMPCFVWNPETGKVEVARWRGGCSFTDGANNAFQALMSDITKRAYCTMTREAYLGVKDDGSPSPLAGSRFPVVVHDEPVGELAWATAHLSAPRMSEIMVQSGYDLAPDVFWKAEPAISQMMTKDVEPVYDESGKLVLWTPKARVA